MKLPFIHTYLCNKACVLFDKKKSITKKGKLISLLSPSRITTASTFIHFLKLSCVSHTFILNKTIVMGFSNQALLYNL